MPILGVNNACVELFKSIDNGDNDASLFWIQTISDQTISDQKIKDMSCLSQPNSRGETMLTLAIGHSMNDFIVALINTGHSNPNHVLPTGLTALILATRMNNPVVVVALLRVTGIEVEHKDRNGKTALDYAKENDDTYPVILYALRTAIRPNGGAKRRKKRKSSKKLKKAQKNLKKRNTKRTKMIP
jgi:ankyrin repeat protein